MKYTTLGKTGLKVSRLGFGCMRFPMLPDGTVDRNLSIPMLHKAVELGVNYFDTAVFYCHADSQRVLGEAMQGMRDKVILSTKNHMHESPADTWWARLEESLKALRTDYIDIYNMHGMTWATWTQHIDVPGGKLELLRKAKEQGLIRHICCSFHDSPEALVKIAETGAVDSITLQYNLLDRSLHDSISRLHELNVGVVVMGPVGGGRLGVASERIRALTGNRVKSTPEAALRFVLANPGVSVALSGMSSMEMLIENVDIVSNKEPFTAAELKLIDDETNKVREKTAVHCTACGYCMPCPFGVNIPGDFAMFNDNRIYGLTENVQKAYISSDGKAVCCVECGKCLVKCPQKINIPIMLREVTKELDTQFNGFDARLLLQDIVGGSLRARITAKNLTDKAISPVVSLKLAGGARSKPDSLEFGALASNSTVSKTLEIAVPDGAGVLEGDLSVKAGTESRKSGFRIPFLMIPRDRTRWHEAGIARADFLEREDILATHGYRVGLRHDDERIHVTLDIRSMLHALGAKGESGGGRMEVYVDMRSPEHGFGQAPYAEGVDQLFICLGDAGYGAKSGKAYNLNQRNEKTADGVRVSFELPFSEFRKPGWGMPKKIGLDFMFFVYDENKIEIGHPTYGGRQGLFQNPGAFTGAILF